MMPKRKNCRVDYTEILGVKYSVLIEYGATDYVLYYALGSKTLGQLYSDFKFIAENELTVDNYPYTQLPHAFKKIKGVTYAY